MGTPTSWPPALSGTGCVIIEHGTRCEQNERIIFIRERGRLDIHMVIFFHLFFFSFVYFQDPVFRANKAEYK